MIFTWTKKARARRELADTLYIAAAAQAFDPALYEGEGGVPDTLDGRFEMICLYSSLIMGRLGQEPDGRKLSQALFDRVFVGVEQALREMGVGDLSVPRHMKRMMTGFNGRARAYDSALREGAEVLQNVIRRNVFGTVQDPDQARISALVDKVFIYKNYIYKQSIITISLSDILSNLEASNSAQERRYG